MLQEQQRVPRLPFTMDLSCEKEFVVYTHREFSYHCSPTSTPFFFRPRRSACEVNREGSNGARSRQELSPVATNSAIAFPQAGAQAMPLTIGISNVLPSHWTYQQLCPALMNAPSHPSNRPMYGSASGGQGRIHACCFARPMVSYVLAISRKDSFAASTRSMFGGQSSRKADRFRSLV